MLSPYHFSLCENMHEYLPLSSVLIEIEGCVCHLALFIACDSAQSWRKEKLI